MAIPTKLYKYRNIDSRTQDIITKHQVFFAAPASFNDPFDCKMPLDFSSTPDEFEAWLRVAAPGFGIPPTLLEELVAKGRSSFAPNYFSDLANKYVDEISHKSSVFCMSERNDDILMFSHYSSSHGGCCLEFDFTADPLLRKAERVEYATNYPDLNYFRLHGDTSEMGRRLILTKSSHWAYEKEWRVIRFRQPPSTYSIAPSCLTGIIFGANISTTDEATVRGWVAARGTPVQFYRAKVDSAAFKLNILPVP